MTQPNDPRKVKVILELIDHTKKIAEDNERGDLAERLGLPMLGRRYGCAAKESFSIA